MRKACTIEPKIKNSRHGPRMLWMLALLLMGDPAQAQGTPRLADRIAAVVEGEIITLSDLHWLVRYRNMPVPESPDLRREFYRQMLDQLIDEELIAREAERTPGIEVTPTEVDQRLDQYRSQFASEEEFQDRLSEMQVSLGDLRLLTRRQLAVYRYLKLRIEPFIIVLPDEIETYYRQSLVPELEANSQPVPSLEMFEEEIRQILSVQKTTREIDLWVSGQRRKSDIRILLFRRPPGAPNLPRELQAQVKIRRLDG